MSIKLVIQPKVLFYHPVQLERWKHGDRDDCSDPVCRNAIGVSGFGEFVVGAEFERRGYRWIHHDFDVFGTNRSCKYPDSEAVLREYLGEERFAAARGLVQTLKPFREHRRAPVETPDLMIFNPDGSELRFAECKRTDTRDKLNRRQMIGLALIAAVFRCPIDVYLIAPAGAPVSCDPIEMEFPGLVP